MCRLKLDYDVRRAGAVAPIRIDSRRSKSNFHEKLRGAYLQLAAAEPQRCVIIDATAPKKMVAKHIWQTVSSRLKPAAARRSLEHVAS